MTSAIAKKTIRTADDEIIELFEPLLFDPYGWVLAAIDWKDDEGPDDWQKEVLINLGKDLMKGATLGDAIRTAISSGHGSGKTALICWIILFCMSTMPHLSGVVTANTSKQLETKTWRELAVWHKRLINSHWFTWTATKFYHNEHPETWFCAAIPNSEHNSEAFAGQHAKHVLVVYDEASLIPNIIWEVSEGAMTTGGAIWIVTGNPTRSSGKFYDCFHDQKHRWRTYKIDCRNAKMADKRLIQSWLEDYGEDSDFFRVRGRGEFPRAAATQFISTESVDEAIKRKIDERVWSCSRRFLGVDVARFGDDSTVLIRRYGRKVFKPEKYNRIDTMEVAARVAETYRKHKIDLVFVDGNGVGAGVVDRLRQLGIPVIDVQAGSRSSMPSTYANMRAEVWGRMRDWLADADLPEDCPELKKELISIEYGFNPKYQIILEKKETMKARGLPSPDHAEALAMTFAPEHLYRVEAKPFGLQPQRVKSAKRNVDPRIFA